MRKKKENNFIRNKKKMIFFFVFLISLIFFSIYLLFSSCRIDNFKNINDLAVLDNKENFSLFPPYYLKDDNINSFSKLSFDSEGIILPSYKKYNPVTVAQYAASLYRYYLKNPNFLIKREFLKQADWLYNNAVVKGNDLAIWEYDFPVKDQGAEPPWISAMAQGEIISVLIEAYTLTGNREYLELAHKALGPFKFDIEKGGVKSYWPDGSIFYEEYATEKKYKVLNGFIFALAGVYDLYRFEKNPIAKKIFDEGVESLKKKLENYDALFISYYSLSKKPTKCESYHKIHIKQLSWLYYITGDRFFLEYAKLFNAYCPQQKKYSIYTFLPKDVNYKKEFKLKNGDFFKDYWSSDNQFPVKIKIFFDKKIKLSGLNMISLSEKDSPQDYDIFYKNFLGIKLKIDRSKSIIKKNDFEYLKSLKNYTTQIIFSKSVYIKEIEIVIYSSKSNENLVMKEIVPLFLEDDYFYSYYNNLFDQFSFLDYKVKQ
ncbi:MAG: D-glucuronyl C5-epimerase family protein [Candidatus Pacebacteria bacterium]|nr:D-glucuronyl C5-epimerase family protein [Candidatus Paceibacterota bacterium]